MRYIKTLLVRHHRFHIGPGVTMNKGLLSQSQPDRLRPPAISPQPTPPSRQRFMFLSDGTISLLTVKTRKERKAEPSLNHKKTTRKEFSSILFRVVSLI